MPSVDLTGIEVYAVEFNVTGEQDVTAILGDPDTSSYITMAIATGGHTRFRVASQTGNAGGFETWTPPEGATGIVEQYVVVARASGQQAVSPPGTYGTTPEAETLPFFELDTVGTGNYAIDYIPNGAWGEVVGRFERLESDLDLNRIDLRTASGMSIDLAYFAKRVTWDEPAPEPVTAEAATRQYPRDDNRGLGSPRLYPPPKSGRVVGGYL